MRGWSAECIILLPSHIDAREYIRKDIARKVKPLVWVDLGDKWGTVTSGSMQITQKFVAPYWSLSGAGAEADADTFHSLEDAEAAAQADYEARILSALEDLT